MNILKPLETPNHPLFLVLLCISIASSLIMYIKASKHVCQSDEYAVYEKIVASNFSHELTFLEREIFWDSPLDLVNPPAQEPAFAPTEPYVLLYVDDTKCNVCTENETQMAIELAKKYGGDRVVCVLHTQTRRKAIKFANENNVPFRVYFDKDKSFAIGNQLPGAPLICAVDPTNHVKLVHLPIPGYSEICKAFHGYLDHWMKH